VVVNLDLIHSDDCESWQSYGEMDRSPVYSSARETTGSCAHARFHDYPQLERSASGLDVPQHFVTTVLYDVPLLQKVALFRTPFSVAGKSPPSSPHSPIFPCNVSNNIDYY
jgi:hypothetical protein